MAMYASMSCRLKTLLQSYTVILHCGWQLPSMDVQQDSVAGCSCQADHTLLRSQKVCFPLCSFLTLLFCVMTQQQQQQQMLQWQHMAVSLQAITHL